MARVDIKAGGTILATGLLQLQNGAAMSSTLTAVTDQNNNASQLKLASNLTQVAGTLQIALDGGTYIDAQDTSGIDRFNVNRAGGSQQVNVDFASNPTLATTAIGAFRTYKDGVNLSEAVTLLRNGNVGVGTTSPSELLTIFNGNGTYGTSSQSLGLGSFLKLGNYYNVGILNNSGQPMSFNASNFSFSNNYTGLGAMVGIKGTGSTSATTSLLVQNSGGTQLGYVDDSGQWMIGTGTNGGYSLDVNGYARVRNNFYFGTAGSYLFADTNNIRLYDKNNAVILQAYPTGVVNSETYLASSSSNKFIRINDNAISLEWFNGNSSSTTQNPIKITRGYFGNVGATDKSVLLVESQFYSSLSNATTLRGIYININDTTTYTGFTSVRAIEAPRGGAYFNTTSVNASAILQADSTTQGFLPPRMTDAQVRAIASPAVGLMAYNTDLDCPVFYSSAGWRKISHSAM